MDAALTYIQLNIGLPRSSAPERIAAGVTAMLAEDNVHACEEEPRSPMQAAMQPYSYRYLRAKRGSGSNDSAGPIDEESVHKQTP